MRVMCITLEDFTKGHSTENMKDFMNIGDEFGVVSECIGYDANDNEVACYDLAGFVNICFDKRNFAIMPDQDADEIDAVEQEAIVPNPMVVESDPLSVEEKAIKAYCQVYGITGCEHRATAAFYETLQNPLP